MIDNLKIATSDFKNITDFKQLFDEYYWDMLEKYKTLDNEASQEDSDEYDDSITSNSISLAYHLQKRGIHL